MDDEAENQGVGSGERLVKEFDLQVAGMVRVREMNENSFIVFPIGKVSPGSEGFTGSYNGLVRFMGSQEEAMEVIVCVKRVPMTQEVDLEIDVTEEGCPKGCAGLCDE